MSEIDDALFLLKQKIFVLFRLKMMDVIEREGIDVRRSASNQYTVEELINIRKWYSHYRPILENALKDIYPAIEEFGKPLEWHYYPLEGVICHTLGNTVGIVKSFMRDYLDLGTTTLDGLNLGLEELSEAISEYLEQECQKIKDEIARLKGQESQE